MEPYLEYTMLGCLSLSVLVTLTEIVKELRKAYRWTEALHQYSEKILGLNAGEESATGSQQATLSRQASDTVTTGISAMLNKIRPVNFRWHYRRKFANVTPELEGAAQTSKDHASYLEWLEQNGLWPKIGPRGRLKVQVNNVQQCAFAVPSR